MQEKLQLVGRNIELNEQIKQLEVDKEKEDGTVPMHALRTIFTPGQIQILMSRNTKSRIKWSAEDITSAIALRSISPKAYRYLRHVKKMPLPCRATLQNWCATFNIPSGILKDVLGIMKEQGQKLCTIERVTVLTFDELYVSNKIDLERKEQKIYGSHRTCQFVMARGLFHKWKQPVYYFLDFDKPTSAHILLTIINSLYEMNYTVVAVTCDMGPTNITLWNELNIGFNTGTNSLKQKRHETKEKQNYILHPADNLLQIFFFADVPHLLKLGRNNLLDSGFKIKGSYIDKTCLEELLKIQSGDLKIAHKLSVAYLDVRDSQRQNVKLAAQVFSNKNTKAIRWCGEKGLLTSPQWEQTVNTFQLFNDWFDIHNSILKYGHCNTSHAYGINLEQQNKIIDSMNDYIKEMRVGKRSALLQFQKGILISNKSLVEMFLYVQEHYLFTRRLNQDILENLFSYLRMMGGGYDHPTPVEIRNRLKWYILGKHSGYTISSGTNTCGDNSLILTDIEDTHSNVVNTLNSSHSIPNTTVMVNNNKDESCMDIEGSYTETEEEAMETEIEDAENSEGIVDSLFACLVIACNN